jgi:signal peptidase
MAALNLAPGRRLKRMQGGRLSTAAALAAVVAVAAALSMATLPVGFHYAPPAQGRMLTHDSVDTPVRGRVRSSHLLGRIIYGAVMVVMLALCAALGSAALTRPLGYGLLVVHGGSMEPAVPNGSLTVIRSLDAADVEAGDVIVLTRDGEDAARPRLHRVTEVSVDGDSIAVRTKGDANATEDPGLHILPARVAVPVSHVPYLGLAFGFMRTPLGWLLAVALPAAALCALAIRDIWSGDQRWNGKTGR